PRSTRSRAGDGGAEGEASLAPTVGSGRDRGQAAVRGPLQPPAALVDEPVMCPAQKPDVPQRGGAAVDPVAEMVTVGPGHWPVADGEPAVLVAQHDRPPHRRRNRP